ncbi:MAG: hypothetical protein E7467_07945 [Ruminococcaceae bacterium]|nr:hypothetical protein [Oscillospiraceae bacterium]
MNRRVFALLLCLVMLLTACGGEGKKPTEQKVQATFFGSSEKPTEQTKETTEPTESTKPTESEEKTEPTHTPYEEYERDTNTLWKERSFHEIVYERPDDQKILDGFKALLELIESGADCDEILEAYRPLNADTMIFSTMASYAYIRYSLDLNDTFYDEEYKWTEERTPVLAQAEEKCLLAMAKSDARDALEEEYFGEDFFVFYEQNPVYSNDRVVELMQEESALQAEYMALQNEKTITWKGEERSVDALLDDDSLAYEDYMKVVSTYYDKYNPQCSEILAKLIRVRNEMAQELDYESYAHFAYAYFFRRDYTPEDVEKYLDDIALNMQNLYFTAARNDYSVPMKTEETMRQLKRVAYGLGDEFATAYDFMEAYDLYDISESASKMPGSYATYLSAYGMPFMYISPTNEINDLMTASHEFGHFVDAYINGNETISIDCNEIFSQSLEYLALDEADLNDEECTELRKSQAANAVQVFLSQACYADFEMQIYQLEDEELTAENFNRIYAECIEKYLYEVDGMEDIYGPGWFEVLHFFVSAHYVISYCTSLDAALQVYQLHLEDGNGLELYRKLLSLAPERSINELLKLAEMTSPFAEGRMEDLADFLYEQMKQ